MHSLLIEQSSAGNNEYVGLEGVVSQYQDVTLEV